MLALVARYLGTWANVGASSVCMYLNFVAETSNLDADLSTTTTTTLLACRYRATNHSDTTIG